MMKLPHVRRSTGKHTVGYGGLWARAAMVGEGAFP